MWGGRDSVFPVPIAAPADVLRESDEEIVIAPQDGWLARTMRAHGDELYGRPQWRCEWKDKLGGVFTPLARMRRPGCPVSDSEASEGAVVSGPRRRRKARYFSILEATGTC